MCLYLRSEQLRGVGPAHNNKKIHVLRVDSKGAVQIRRQRVSKVAFPSIKIFSCE